jgi:tripeptidyl-peptidase-1
MNDSGMSNIGISKKHFWGKCDPNTEDPDIEATLDIQYQTGVNNNTDLYYVSAKDWLYQLSNLVYRSDNPPKVLSMSYGWAEWDQCDPNVFPTCLIYKSAEQYSKRSNIEFMKLGLRGITLVASSGDAGAPGRTNEGCDGDNKLNPAFPASSPWVLAIGGTIIMNATTIKDPQTTLCKTFPCIGGGVELNCNIERCGWTAGGGFSGFFNRPPWQINASDNYLNSSTEFPPPNLFNKNGRIYPDLALVSHNYLINTPSGYTNVDGTSASAPSVSGMISILNNLRVSNKKSTLGPVGPLLYAMQNDCETCFKDITIGSNNSTEQAECKWGYNAVKGFDAVYGLGVPNFKDIYSYVEKL